MKPLSPDNHQSFFRSERRILSRCRVASLVVIVLGFGILAQPAKAGFLAILGAKVGNFSLRPLDEEATPNYYGIGPAISLGYSIRQVMDVAVFCDYVPGRLRTPDIGSEHAQYLFYGGELALRIAESVYFGLRGGTARYHLIQQNNDSEVPGKWTGYGAGFSIGALRKINKRNYVQVSFNLMSSVIERKNPSPDEEKPGNRRMDGVSLGVAYVFNGFSNYMIDNTIFKSFLDSISIF